MIARADIEAAYERILPYIRLTPVMHMDADAFRLGYPLTLKMAHLQATLASSNCVVPTKDASQWLTRSWPS